MALASDVDAATSPSKRPWAGATKCLLGAPGEERTILLDRPQFLDVHSPEGAIDVFLHLARASRLDGRRMQEDKFLLLAGCAAQQAGYGDVAERCRALILDHSPTHMLRQYASMTEAASAEDVLRYAEQLRAIYPLEKADYLLVRLRAAGYEGDHEFSAEVGRGHAPRAKGAMRPRRRKKSNGSSTAPPERSPPSGDLASDAGITPLPFQWPLERPRNHRLTLYAVIFVVGCLLGVLIAFLIPSEVLPWNQRARP